jgi:hypothetical protein
VNLDDVDGRCGEAIEHVDDVVLPVAVYVDGEIMASCETARNRFSRGD